MTAQVSSKAEAVPSELELALKKRRSSAPEPAVKTQPYEDLSFWDSSTDPITQITTMQGLNSDQMQVLLTAEFVNHVEIPPQQLIPLDVWVPVFPTSYNAKMMPTPVPCKSYCSTVIFENNSFFFNFHPASMRTCAVDCQLCMEAIASFATQIRALAKTGYSQTTSGACSYLENLSCSQQQQASGQGRKASR